MSNQKYEERNCSCGSEMVKHSIQRNGTMNMLNKNVFFLILT